jgi:hypothetical protein
MDNKQIRTAMVQVALSKTSWDSDSSGISAEEIRKHTFEGMERIYQWRESASLNKSMIARGLTEGLWYVDFLRDPITPWADLIATTSASLDRVLILTKPNKCLSFAADVTLSTFLYKKKNPEAQICFVNNQPFWNFEEFIRDFSFDAEDVSYMDIEYHVADIEEIGSGDATNFDFIHMRIEDVSTDSTILQNCVNALASGGTLLISATNNTEKLYRDDFFFHPNYELHKILKSNNGLTYHVSEGHGHTIFIKD